MSAQLFLVFFPHSLVQIKISNWLKLWSLVLIMTLGTPRRDRQSRHGIPVVTWVNTTESQSQVFHVFPFIYNREVKFLVLQQYLEFFWEVPYSSKLTFLSRVTFCKNDTKSSTLIFDPLRFCSCLVKVLVLVKNCKILKLSSTGHVLFELWTLTFTLKSAQNAKFDVNNTLRWNNSNLLTDWETVLTFSNYMGEINSESISKFQVPQPN